MQQALAKPGVLSRFVSDPQQVRAISEIFTGLFSLDDTAEGNAAIELALKNPSKYVLKPQREGGGNNVYDEDIPAALQVISQWCSSRCSVIHLYIVTIENDETRAIRLDPDGAHLSADFQGLHCSTRWTGAAAHCRSRFGAGRVRCCYWVITLW